MADDDDLFDEDEFSDDLAGDAEGDGAGGKPGARRGGDDDSLGLDMRSIREWLTARRGWLLILGLAAAQGVFATIVIHLRSQSTPVAEIRSAAVRDFATDMLGYEVKVNQIYQLLPMRAGKRMTVGLDLVLVLGQFPEERIEGSPRPTPEEMAVFAAAIGSLEPGVRSMVNLLLQRMPPDDLSSISGQNTIKSNVREYVNNTLDSLDFGGAVRPEIGKRRVTDVLLPMFVTQYM